MMFRRSSSSMSANSNWKELKDAYNKLKLQKALKGSMRQLVENAVEAMKPIKPREAATKSERARLFWKWAFEEIKKGKMTKKALNNVPLNIGKQELIDI